MAASEFCKSMSALIKSILRLLIVLVLLYNNKLSDNNLASELVENRTFFKLITSEEIVIFMIKCVITVNYPK